MRIVGSFGYTTAAFLIILLTFRNYDLFNSAFDKTTWTRKATRLRFPSIGLLMVWPIVRRSNTSVDGRCLRPRGGEGPIHDARRVDESKRTGFRRKSIPLIHLSRVSLITAAQVDRPVTLRIFNEFDRWS